MSELLSEIVIYYSLGEEVKLSHVCFVYGQVTEKIAKKFRGDTIMLSVGIICV